MCARVAACCGCRPTASASLQLRAGKNPIPPSISPHKPTSGSRSSALPVRSCRAYRCAYKTAGIHVELPRLLRGTALCTVWQAAPRDRDFRWSHDQRTRHLLPILNHARFPILPRFPSKNPPSMILAGAHEVLPGPWQSAHDCRFILAGDLGGDPEVSHHLPLPCGPPGPARSS